MREYGQKKENIRKNIVLIGFMGSGKSTVGVRLSYLLRQSMDDTDKIIERREGKSISDIFAEKGEACFRTLETKLLKELVQKSHHKILSLGGGTPVKEENRVLIRRLGTVVYLRIRPESVVERLQDDTLRPLLQGEDRLEKVTALLEARKEAYESTADIIIDVDDLSADQCVEQIMKALEQKTWKNAVREPREKRGCGMKILVINGPNINFLGIREKSIYGAMDYQYLLDMIEEKGRVDGHEIEVFQSNHEGDLIDRIQDSYFDGTEGIVINPGAFTHYSYAIRDALASIRVKKVEIHISDITQREKFRKISVTAPVCDKQIYGQGLDGYNKAIDYITKDEKFN